jgi:hypothetical protein
VHAATAVVFVAWQKYTADAVLAGLRKLDVTRLAFATEERIRQLNQDAGTVAREGIAAAGTAMHEVQKDIDSFFDDVVGGPAGDVGDEADATGVVLVARVVESSTLR